MNTFIALLFIIGLCLAGAESDPSTPMTLGEIAINVTGLGMFVLSMVLASGMRR